MRQLYHLSQGTNTTAGTQAEIAAFVQPCDKAAANGGILAGSELNEGFVYGGGETPPLQLRTKLG